MSKCVAAGEQQARPCLAQGEAVGILAGSGALPRLFVEGCREHGVGKIVGVGIRGETDAALTEMVDAFQFVRVGQFARIVEFFRTHRVTKLAFEGSLAHGSVFDVLHMDVRVLHRLLRLPDRRADTILGGLVNLFEEEGFEVLPSTLFFDRLLPEPGLMTRCAPRKEQWKDIRFGIQIARAVGAHDIGQTVVVKKGVVVAVEALEGTSAAIRRGGKLAGKGSVVVKLAKPGQDFRFDVPVIGTGTLEALKEARCAALAVEAGKTIVLDREQLVDGADRIMIPIVAVNVADREACGEEQDQDS